MNRNVVVLTAILFHLTGCATSFEVPELTGNNPAHPDAEQGSMGKPSMTLENVKFPSELSVDSANTGMDMTDMKSRSTDEGKTKKGINTTEMPGKETYTCPMHPEVIAQQPGKCPKCGMALVKRKEDRK